jgi:type II secretory pathway pseudopilin PulG
MGASSSNNLGNSGFGNSDDDYGFSSFSTASDSAADTTRKNDINSLYQKLEEYYNENGSYPNEPISSFNASELFPGIDSDALIDENGNDILVNFDDSIYIINYPYPDSTNQYVLTLYGEGCDGFSGDTSCQSYTLAGYQATGFIDYVKSSLN